MEYLVYKLTHIVSAVLWLGPATGAYWILIRLSRQLAEPERIALEKNFEEVLRLEHLAFIVLLASGAALYFKGGWDVAGDGWIKIKLALVGIIVLIEIADVWISHIVFRKSLTEQNSDAFTRFLRMRRQFYFLAIPLLMILIPAVLYLGVMKGVEPF